ncbi:MAG: hypothetical protein ACXQTX_02390 [Candidatus Syntropharchaeia archaeon]
MMGIVLTCDFKDRSEITFEFILTKKQWRQFVESMESESFAVLKDEDYKVEVTLSLYDEEKGGTDDGKM